MPPCKHSNLTLLPEPKKRLRCRHCHLTIADDEIGEGDCPECFEKYGEKRSDFEEIASKETRKIQYRCEDCGTIIKSE